MRDETAVNTQKRKMIGRWISITIVAGAVGMGIVVLSRTNYYPRTDDAEILANFIGIAPQVDGPLVRLNVKDNQHVKTGDLLYEIDERPYRYALENALSEQAALEGQIADEQRRIAALVSAVSVAQENIHSAEAEVTDAERGVGRARAEWTYANNNLRRLEPLLAKKFVTVDQVDKARSSETAMAEAQRQAESQLTLSQAKLKSVLAQHEQARHAVTTLEPLINQRGAKAAAVKNAQYQLNNCRVYAAFEGIVTNLTISEGAYAHVGQEMFTLIDARNWWAIGNFREGLLGRIAPGMKADVYVMSRPNLRFSAVVDSVGFGVTPDPDRIGNLSRGLPDIQRTLNWVHLASRYPVRVRVENPTPDLFRVGESAVVTIRGD
jgi:membrane fusion protein, multidrug efflux system